MIEKKKPHPTIMCIPDLTGFTKFMSRMDTEYASVVIPDLLKGIINSNQINMEVGEIQGDAVFFYAVKNLPSIRDMVEQCKKIFLDFVENIRSLEKVYKAGNPSLKIPDKLGLKIIIHSGEVTLTPINGQKKLMGEDVIKAHRLLKNSIDIEEYILFTEKFLARSSEEELEMLLDWAELIPGQDEYEHIGVVKYRYINLEPLLSYTGKLAH